MFNSYNNQNPYFNPYFNSPQPQTTMPNMRFNNLQGKSIDNLEVVKAMDIPLDGSISYFPLVDGSAIVTKQLQQVVAFALFNNGEQIPGTLMVETIDAAGDYANIGINKEVRVCCKGTTTISVRAVSTVPTATAPTTPVTTQPPIIGNANLVIDRRC